MAEDFLHQQHVLHRDKHIEVNNDMFNLVLNDLQEKVISMGGRQFSEYNRAQLRQFEGGLAPLAD